MLFTIVGMPGCGKSCMGRAVSSKLKIKLIDSDKLIEAKYGMNLCDLLEEVGVEEFRKIEEETLLSIDEETAIISTGGSAIYSDKAMQYLSSKGKIIYLFCSYPTIEKRLGDYSKRGVVLKPGQTLYGLYKERIPLYNKYANITIYCDGNAFPRFQGSVIRAIKRYLPKQ